MWSDTAGKTTHSKCMVQQSVARKPEAEQLVLKETDSSYFSAESQAGGFRKRKGLFSEKTKGMVFLTGNIAWGKVPRC